MNNNGIGNDAFGSNTMQNNTTGGYKSDLVVVLCKNTTGSYNSAFGTALTANTTGYYNTGVGYNANIQSNYWEIQVLVIQL